MIDKRPSHEDRWTAPAALVRAAMNGDLPHPHLDDLPALNCRGLCSSSCRDQIPMTPVEIGRVSDAIGHPVTYTDGACSALTTDGRCSAYDQRPMICRVWGMAESMICPHGCTTDTGQYLTFLELVGLIGHTERNEGPMARIPKTAP